MKEIRAIIFDFDGTLFDSMSVWINLASQYLISNDIKCCNDIDKIVKNMSLQDACQYMIKNCGLRKTCKQAQKEINDIISDFYCLYASPKKGIKELLDRLSKRNIKMCIATATNEFLIQKALEREKLDKYFDGIFSCQTYNCNKNNSYIYDLALKNLGIEKQNTIVIEDSLQAIKSLKKEDFYVVGVYDQMSADEQEEIKSLADEYYISLENWK